MATTTTSPPPARPVRPAEPRPYRRADTVRRALPHVVLLLCAFAWLYPLLWGLSGSLKTNEGFLDSGLGLIPHQYRWHNFVDAWNGAGIGTYFVNTVVITVLTVLFTLLFSSAAGYVLARTSFPGKGALLAVIAVTFFLPRGYTIIPIYDLVDHLGLLDSLWSVVLVQVAGGMVFNTFMFMGYFRTLGRDVEEAAMVDGASFHQLYLRIALPMARPMLATLGLFVFISSWNDFLIPLVFTLGRPERQTISVGLYSFIGQTSTDWSVLCAGSVISLLPIVLVFAFTQRHVVSAIAGAVKG